MKMADPKLGYYVPFPDMPCKPNDGTPAGGKVTWEGIQGVTSAQFIEIDTDVTNDVSDFGAIRKVKTDNSGG